MAVEHAAIALPERRLASRASYAFTIFLGAFLLFQIQPLMGKFIIPWYGGNPSAWTACLIFFQGGLLSGYLYAHLVVRHLAPRTQGIVHTLLLVACFVLLPIAPGGEWKPAPGSQSMAGIFWLLGANVGMPYLLLASTGPITQAWFYRSFPGGAPYRLFALSNLGSMLALVSYPLLFEPWLTRTAQSWIWAAGFLAFVLACSLCAVSSAVGIAPGGSVAAASIGGDARPTTTLRFLWVALPACASLLLLAVTNQLCLGMPSVPFLWILPLSLYLLSFIICFEWPRVYSRWAFLAAMPVSIAWACHLLGLQTASTAGIQIAAFSLALFVCCMVCHGELALAKPDPRHLTAFYLAVAGGGALGGAFVGLAAPRLFDGFFELHWGLWLCAVLVLFSLFVQTGSPLYRGKRAWAWVALAAGVVWLGVDLRQRYEETLQYTVSTERDFFGVRKLYEAPNSNPAGVVRLLGNGGIIHGFQWIEPPERRNHLTSYYARGTGLDDAFHLVASRGPIRVGVVGLGVGTVAGWGRDGDRFRFYELDPRVAVIAREKFSFLGDTRAEVEVVEGDARLSLEAEPDQRFDLLVLDAFSGDSVPVHLLTAEAFALYRRHLASGGVLAVHISNKYLDLEPVVRSLGAAIGMTSRYRVNPLDLPDVWSAHWVLLSAQPGIFDGLPATGPSDPSRRAALWTDDYANVLATLR
jgi:hypothetical protein